MLSDYYKENESDRIWWRTDTDRVDDDIVFSFDKKKDFHLFQDYPNKLTPEQKEVFDKENPFWADYFKGRVYNGDQNRQ